MSEPWVNFSNQNEDEDVMIFLRPDGLERVHVYVRTDGSFGLRNFFRRKRDSADLWEVGPEWGHHYDSASTAVKEAVGHFRWLSEFFSPDLFAGK